MKPIEKDIQESKKDIHDIKKDIHDINGLLTPLVAKVAVTDSRVDALQENLKTQDDLKALAFLILTGSRLNQTTKDDHASSSSL